MSNHKRGPTICDPKVPPVAYLEGIRISGRCLVHADDAKELQEMIQKSRRKFKVNPLSIIPLMVICQGLP